MLLGFIGKNKTDRIIHNFLLGPWSKPCHSNPIKEFSNDNFLVFHDNNFKESVKENDYSDCYDLFDFIDYSLPYGCVADEERIAVFNNGEDNRQIFLIDAIKTIGQVIFCDEMIPTIPKKYDFFECWICLPRNHVWIFNYEDDLLKHRKFKFKYNADRQDPADWWKSC